MIENFTPGPPKPGPKTERSLTLLNEAIKPFHLWLSDEEKSRLQFRFDDGSGGYGVPNLRIEKLDLPTLNGIVYAFSMAGIPVENNAKQPDPQKPVEFMAIIQRRHLPAEGLDPHLPEKIRAIVHSQPELVPAVRARYEALADILKIATSKHEQQIFWSSGFDSKDEPFFTLNREPRRDGSDPHNEAWIRMKILEKAYERNGIAAKLGGNRKSGYTLGIRGVAARAIIPSTVNENGPQHPAPERLWKKLLRRFHF